MDVTFHAGHAVAVAVHDGAGWRALAPDEATTVALSEPYAVVSACAASNETDVDVHLDLLAPEDGDELWLPCQEPLDPLALRFDLPSGGEAHVWNRITYAAQSEPYELLDAGVYDILVHERQGDYRYLLRRDFELTENTDLTFDLADGAPMELHEVLVDGGAADLATTDTLVRVALAGERPTTSILSPLDPAAFVPALPSSALRAGDRQDAEVIIQLDANHRVRSVVPIVAATIDARPPTPLVEATVEPGPAPHVRWTYDGQVTEVSVTLDDAENGERLFTHASAAWLATTDAESLAMPDVTTMPGWNSNWGSAWRPYYVTVTGPADAEGRVPSATLAFFEE